MDQDPVLALLSFVLANATFTFVGHNRHDKLSEHTNALAKELADAAESGEAATLQSLDKALDSMWTRYKGALVALICFGLGNIFLAAGFLLYIRPNPWFIVVFLPVLVGLVTQVCFDLCPAARATSLRVAEARRKLAKRMDSVGYSVAYVANQRVEVTDEP